jgi:Flp pilus assembly protein TadG
MEQSATKGQALAEMAFVVVMLFVLIMGVAEVGWAFMESSLITHAARDGARFGATLPKADRDVAGCISNETVISDHVEAALTGLGFSPSVNVSQNTCANNGIPTITVQITGTMNTLFNLIGDGFAIDRSITFQDEGRTCPSAC